MTTFGEFKYFCKKTGLTTDTDLDALPIESQRYLMTRGAREYFDNYHASETYKLHGDKIADVVAPLVCEAYERLVVGDVPGTRVARPQTAVQQLANRLAAAGFTAMTDQELAIVIESLARAREAA